MANWHAKNRYAYSKTSTEGWENIQLIYSNLVRSGFSEASACGVLVNMENESGFNPWRWESDNILASTDWTIIDSSMVHGYGLCGWTPSGKYLHDNILLLIGVMHLTILIYLEMLQMVTLNVL